MMSQGARRHRGDHPESREHSGLDPRAPRPGQCHDDNDDDDDDNDDDDDDDDNDNEQVMEMEPPGSACAGEEQDEGSDSESISESFEAGLNNLPNNCKNK